MNPQHTTPLLVSSRAAARLVSAVRTSGGRLDLAAVLDALDARVGAA